MSSSIPNVSHNLSFKLLFIVLITCISTSCVYGQLTRWEIYSGPSLTNTIHSVNGQQIVWTYSLNSPQYAPGFLFGIDRRNKLWRGIELQTGIEIKTKGDKLSKQQFGPDTIYGLELLYVGLPISIAFKILESRQMYFKVGASTDFLVKKNEIAWWVKNNPQLSSRLGIGCRIYMNLFCELTYTEGLSNIYSDNFEYYKTRIRHQSIELSVIYRL